MRSLFFLLLVIVSFQAPAFAIWPLKSDIERQKEFFLPKIQEYSRSLLDAERGTTEEDLINQHSKYVSILTGKSQFKKEIKVGVSKEPISVWIRYKDEIANDLQLSHWQIFPHLYLNVSRGNWGKKNAAIGVYVHDTDGSFLQFMNLEVSCHKKDWVRVPCYSFDQKNTLESNFFQFSYHQHDRLEYSYKEDCYRLTTAAWGVRWYKIRPGTKPMRPFLAHDEWYVLVKEKAPSGVITLYEYDDYFRPIKIERRSLDDSISYSSAHIYYSGNPEDTRDFRMVDHNNENYCFQFKKFGEGKKAEFYLERLSTPYEPVLEFLYNRTEDKSCLQLSRVKYNSKLSLVFQYIKERKNGEKHIEGTLGIKEDQRIGRVFRLIKASSEGPCQNLSEYLYDTWGKASTTSKNTYIVNGLGDQQGFSFDSNHNLTQIFYESGQPEAIKLEKRVVLKWCKKGRVNRLIGEETYNETDRLVESTKMEYNDLGILKGVDYSADITGKNLQQAGDDERKAQFDQHHQEFDYSSAERFLLKKHVREDGNVDYFSYLHDLNLMYQRILKAPSGEILERCYFDYDRYGFLVREQTDDGKSENKNSHQGVTFQKIIEYKNKLSAPAVGFPYEVEEKYLNLETGGIQVLLRKKYAYNHICQVIKEEVFDEQGDLLSLKTFDYNRKGLLISKVDELGNKTVYDYNADGYLITEIDGGTGVTKSYLYDPFYEVREIKAVGISGEKETLSFTTDMLGRKISETDALGNQTSFRYIGHNTKPSAEIKPHIFNEEGRGFPREIRYERDFQENCLRKIDVDTSIEKQTYTIHGHPIETINAIGHKTTRKYDLMGRLLEQVDPDGQRSRFQYDLLGRKIFEEVRDRDTNLLSSKNYRYKGMHLVEIKAHDETMIFLTYDPFGRKTSQTTISPEIEQQEHFEYNALGEIIKHTTFLGSEQQQFKSYLRDPKGRVLEEQHTDEQGRVYLHVQYEYNALDQVTKCTKFPLESNPIVTGINTYDSFGKPKSVIDSYGNTTLHNYEIIQNHLKQNILKTIITHPNQLKEELISDVDGRVFSKTWVSPKGDPFKKEETYYDQRGDKKTFKDFSYENGNPSCIKKVVWNYNPLGQLLSMEEKGLGKERKTTYAYHINGEIAQKTKPDQTTLFYDYTAARKIKRLYSSDQTVDYLYSYDNLQRVVEVEDRIHHKKSTINWKGTHLMAEEELMNGVLLERVCDQSGRLTKLTLAPSSSDAREESIEYQYHSFGIRRVARSTKGNELYSHSYLEHDRLGRIKKESHINSVESYYRFDKGGRIDQKRSSPFTQEILSRDPMRNIIAVSTDLMGNKGITHYAYDDQSQLIKESGESNEEHHFDAHFNPTLVNNQPIKLAVFDTLEKIGEQLCEYDQNGNIIRRGNSRYQYDALDRLTQISTKGHLTTFSYDHLHRKMEYNELKEFELTPKSYRLICQDLHEIGSYQGNYLHELKVNGVGHENEIGAAVAIEIDGDCFAPIVNLFGDIIGLMNLDGEVIEIYHYDVFGLITHSESEIPNPWQYKSKRYYKDSFLYDFGFRFYDPTTKRFISTDPLGYNEGSNLYQFCRNNPLIYVDVYGLSYDLYELEDPSRTDELIGCLLGARNGLYIDEFEHFRKNKSFFDTYQRTSSLDHLIFINGIRTSKTEFLDNITYLQDILPHINIHGIYNSSGGSIEDVIECVLGLRGVETPPVKLLQKHARLIYNDLKHGGTLTLTAHSQGAIHTYNAVRGLSEEMRNNIRVLTIAPAKFMTTDLVKYSKNILTYDFVPELQYKFGHTDTNAIIEKIPDPPRESYREKTKGAFITEVRQMLDNHKFTNSIYKPYIKEFFGVK